MQRAGRLSEKFVPGAMAETDNREQELQALHRSYRMMETDRQKYSEESQVRHHRCTSDKCGFFLGCVFMK